MNKKISFLMLFFTIFSGILFAQKKTVTGKVTDEDGLGLPGVSVLVKGTSRGISTDFDGKYQIEANTGEVLVYSSVGYSSQEKKLSGGGKTLVINVVLKEQTQQLGEVVVTALGIKREEKALSYNVQQVNSEELTKVKDANFINALNGKVAGVTINRSSSGIGGASKVIMRGQKSIEKSNNALYVVDGVPMLSLTRSQGEGKYNSDGSTESIADINPLLLLFMVLLLQMVLF